MRTLRDHLRSNLAAARLVRLTTLLLLLPALSGCGYLLVNGPPAEHEQMTYFSCTESNAGPIIDAVVAGLEAAGTIAVAVDSDEYEDSGALIGGGVFWTALLGSAAVVGLNKTADCRAAKRAHAERQAQGHTPRPPPEPVSRDTAEIPGEARPDTGQLERSPGPTQVEVRADTMAPDTLEILYTEYTNPWLNRFDFRRDREVCEDAVEDRLEDGSQVTEDRFELMVRRCLAGKGWERTVAR